MAPESGDELAGPIGTITKALGLLAGLATLVYLAGGFVLALRLGFEDLPWDSVISSIPREFLISVGVTVLVAPVLFAAIGYVGLRVWRGREIGLPDNSRPSTNAVRLRFAGQSAALALGLILPGAVIELCKDGSRLSLWIWLAVAWLASFVWTYEMLCLRAAIARRHSAADIVPDGKRGWYEPRAVALMTGLYGAMLLPGAIIVGATLPMTDVKACGAGGAEISGSFVGDTESRLYVGEHLEIDESGGSTSRRILSIPYSSLGEVYIGEEAFAQDCLTELQQSE